VGLTGITPSGTDPGPPHAARLPWNEGWRTLDLLSDLHLGPATPRTLAALWRTLDDSDADAVVLLGDIVEAWVGDDAADDPAGFEAAFLDGLRLRATRRWIGVMTGNRDFLWSEASRRRQGLHPLADPTALVMPGGEAWLLTHGDALCIDDTDYQRFRRQSRSDAWQSSFLARPLAERVTLVRDARDASESRKRRDGLAGYADADAATMRAWLTANGARHLIHGHTHRPGHSDLGDGLHRWVLSDWDADEAVPPRGDRLRLHADGRLERVAVTTTAD
jgi:UDP-2,3-diacylglucosamine hydrolase